MLHLPITSILVHNTTCTVHYVPLIPNRMQGRNACMWQSKKNNITRWYETAAEDGLLWSSETLQTRTRSARTVYKHTQVKVTHVMRAFAYARFYFSITRSTNVPFHTVLSAVFNMVKVTHNFPYYEHKYGSRYPQQRKWIIVMKWKIYLTMY
jgi:hypothetical protein